MPFCTQCGKKADEGDSFCTKCGKAIISVAEEKPLPKAGFAQSIQAPEENFLSAIALPITAAVEQEDAEQQSEPPRTEQMEDELCDGQAPPPQTNTFSQIIAFLGAKNSLNIKGSLFRTGGWMLLTYLGILVSLFLLGGADPVIFSLAGYALALGCLMPFIILMLSKFIIKKSHHMIKQIVPGRERNDAEREMTALITGLCKRAGLETTPEIWIYGSPDVNAFATGPSRSNAMIAFSSALIEQMDQRAIAGVAAHEILHIANGDMLTLSLVQGAVNAFTYPIWMVCTGVVVLLKISCASEHSPAAKLMELILTLIYAIFTAVLFFMGSLVVKAFSRLREFRADATAAAIIDKESMVHALEMLGDYYCPAPREQRAFAAMKINTPSALWDIFATHPSLPRRIERLRQMKSLL